MNRILLFVFLLSAFSVHAQRNPFKNLSEKNGKIGIGTQAPDELLTVKGVIHTQEVKVDLDGAVAPDYVFEHYFDGTSRYLPEYRLRSLGELESFIAKHHHLPNVPSAEDLEKNGVELKQLTLILLEKIEELTLYTLEQQKEIDTLKQQLEQQKGTKSENGK